MIPKILLSSLLPKVVAFWSVLHQHYPKVTCGMLCVVCVPRPEVFLQELLLQTTLKETEWSGAA